MTSPAPAGSRKKCALLLSYHLYRQRRRGGMHWLCDSIRKAGWDVRFVTCDFSWITRAHGDRRTKFGEPIGYNKLVRLDDSLSVGIVHTPFHPIGRDRAGLPRLLDGLTGVYPWPAGNIIRKFSAGTDLVIIESCGALMMLDDVKAATDAPVAYRVSDNIRAIRPVPSLLQAEVSAASKVDVISLASENLALYFADKGNIRIDPMGLDKQSFDAATSSPYPDDGRVKVVISGSSGLDVESLLMAAEQFPDWDFIQFGEAQGIPDLKNIIIKGEVAFRDMVPWVKFADIGFAPYIVRPGFEYQSEHSNRLLQYIYSGLPCVVPEELKTKTKEYYVGYRAGDRESIANAFQQASRMDRGIVPINSVLDWDQVAQRILGTRKLS